MNTPNQDRLRDEAEAARKDADEIAAALSTPEAQHAAGGQVRDGEVADWKWECNACGNVQDALGLAHCAKCGGYVGGLIAPQPAAPVADVGAVCIDPSWTVLAEHSGCGYGTQVDQITVRVNRGDKVVLIPAATPSPVAQANGAAAVGDGASALWALRQILHDLPDERGWMDPAVEKIARGLVARNPYADLATPSAPVGVEGLRTALCEAGSSLTAIATLAGRDEFMADMSDVRAYANSRAECVRTALAATPAVSVGDAKDGQ